MLRKKAQFTLKLSREKIQLFLNNKADEFNEIGSADPNQSDIGQNLKELRNQVHALTGKVPVIDVMLPDELILIQNLTIKNFDNPLSKGKATELISKACRLEKDEINVAVGLPTSDRTQPAAAVTAKTLRETQQFLENAGFKTNNFMASRSFVGFSQLPIFSQAPPSEKSLIKVKNAVLPIVLSVTVLLLISSIIFVNKPFEKFEFSNSTNNSNSKSPTIITEPPPKNLTNLEAAIGKKFLLESYDPPSIEGIKVLSFPKKNNGPILPKISSSERSTADFYFKKKMELSIISNDLSSSQSTRLNFSEQSQVPELEEKYQAEHPNSLNHNVERLNMLRQYSKFQTLKSFIQADYLASIQPNFSKEDSSISIKEHLLLKPATEQFRKEVNKSETIAEPRLSLIEKIKLQLVNKMNPIRGDIKIETLVDRKRNSETSITSLKKLENPKTIFDQEEAIENLIALESESSVNYQLSPEQILLSKKYKPIFRPSLIGKINVLLEPTISSGAVTLSQNPIMRPKSVATLSPVSPSNVKIVAKATKRPSFPQRASIVNNSTIHNIIELNRTNLIGIFGTKQNAIALVRLASGRIIKVQVGDRFEGWKVLKIYNDKIELANGNKQEMLRLPG